MEEKKGTSNAEEYFFRKQIVKLIGDVPRIELFSRNKSVGLDAWGNEIKNDIEFDIFSPKK